MKARGQAMVIALGMLALMPGVVKGQMSAPGGREGMGVDRGRGGAESSAMPMMEQMERTIRQMADALKTGSMTPEQQRRMGEVMGQMGDMMGDRQAMHARMPDIMNRMAEMRKRIDDIMANSPSAAPQPKKP